MRTAQARIWEEGLALPGTDTDVWDRPYRERDRIHLNAEGTRRVAGKWAETLLRQLQ